MIANVFEHGAIRIGGRPAGSVVSHVRGWLVRLEERRHLLDLDDRLLRDIGLTREQAEREAAKPFWQR